MTDEETLREYMEQQFHGLHADRSTASYALEFLQTGQANLLLAQHRANLTQAVSQMNQQVLWINECRKWLDELGPRALALCEKLRDGK